jgi:hypothetical protein
MGCASLLDEPEHRLVLSAQKLLTQYCILLVILWSQAKKTAQLVLGDAHLVAQVNDLQTRSRLLDGVHDLSDGQGDATGCHVRNVEVDQLLCIAQQQVCEVLDESIHLLLGL